MSNSYRDRIQPAFGQNWGYFLTWGILLIILGLITLYFDTMTTLISVIIIGVMFVIAGIVVIIDSFQFWRDKKAGLLLHLLMGLFYLIAGLILIRGPVIGAISITLVLGVLFLILGLFRIVFSLSHRLSYWGWNLFSGLITLILGIFILIGWPASSLFILGLFVGIDLILIGWAYIMVALAAKNLAHK